MKPVTLVTVRKIYENDWLAAQDFGKYGEVYRLRGFGRTRREALYDLQLEIEIADLPDEPTWFDRLCCWLYDIAGFYPV